MDVYWLEQSVADLTERNDWLSNFDMAQLNAMRFEKRRSDWRLGRWTAKHALAVCLELPADSKSLAGIEIRAASSGAPEVFLANQRAEVTISLSHSAGHASCAVAVSRVALGCDLEVVEPRSDDFVADYFTAEEQELIKRVDEANRAQMVTLLWSAKESALKALGEGLRLDTRSVVVNPLPVRPGRKGGEAGSALTFASFCGSTCWHPLKVRFGSNQMFEGWWRQMHNVMQTLVAAPSPLQPISLLRKDRCSEKARLMCRAPHST